MTSFTDALSNPVADAPKPAAAAARAEAGFALGLPPRPALLSRRAWLALVALCIAIGVGVPLAALVAPESSAFHRSASGMTFAGGRLCYAMPALARGLVWGYCGILSLGRGLFCAPGGYAMALS
ncbi:urea ABC transporter permease subunit UrtC, partial [Burkholderia thailandensis]|nr:urea ABC transporter permease subunit UrtC [Burkholderia thailandensis]